MGIENHEQIDEEPTPTEIADACREVLDPESCEEIAQSDDSEAALGLAWSFLVDAGIEDPEEFLRSKNILE